MLWRRLSFSWALKGERGVNRWEEIKASSPKEPGERRDRHIHLVVGVPGV